MLFERRQYKQFLVEENGFTYKGQFFEFSEIRHLSFCQVLTTQKQNFIKVGEANIKAAAKEREFDSLIRALEQRYKSSS